VKLFAAFIAVCAIMVGVTAWFVFSGLEFGPAEAGVAPPLTRPAPPEDRLPAPSPDPLPGIEARAAEQHVPTAVPGEATRAHVVAASTVPAATAPAAQATVRWAADPVEQADRRRLEAARAALRSDPDHPAALRDELAALVGLRRWEEAVNTATRLVSLTPGDDELRFELGALQIKARRWTEAIATLRDWVARHPAEPRGWFNLAVAHQAAGHLADARATWDRCMALAPSVEARARRGEVLLDVEDWAAAADDFAAACAEQGSSPELTLNLALALWKLGRTGEARTRLLALLAEHPRHVPTLNRLAEMAWAACVAAAPDERQPCEEAAEWCRRSLECDPTQPEIEALRAAALRPRS